MSGVLLKVVVPAAASTVVLARRSLPDSPVTLSVLLAAGVRVLTCTAVKLAPLRLIVAVPL